MNLGEHALIQQNRMIFTVSGATGPVHFYIGLVHPLSQVTGMSWKPIR